MASSAGQASKYRIAPVRGTSSGKRPATGRKDPNQVLKDTLKAREDDVSRLTKEIELLKDTIGGLMVENRALRSRYVHVVRRVLALQQQSQLSGVGDSSARSSATAGVDAVAEACRQSAPSGGRASTAATLAADVESGGRGSTGEAKHADLAVLRGRDAGRVDGSERPCGDADDIDVDGAEASEALATDPELVVRAVNKLAEDRAETLSKRSAMETRVEELETRLTEQSLQLARLAARNSFCTSVVGNGSLADDDGDVSLSDVRERLNVLRHHLAMESPLFEDPRRVPLFSLDPAAPDREEQLSSLLAAESGALPYGLTKPVAKLPGDTHIKAMNPELRNYVMHELSMERASGADWRALAERVGIGAPTVDSWRRLRLPCPTSQVLAFWGDSAGATVRMLHRHLMSPQLRALVLAKRIADFYDVS